jgi:hypothetical protein
MSEKLWPFEFKDTGIVVSIRKVSPLLTVELRKAFPPPAPPMQAVDVAGEMVEEINFSDPDYIKASEEYAIEFENQMRELLVERGVIIPETNTTWKNEVTELREFWRSRYGKELGPNDKMEFILHIAVGTDMDFMELIRAITTRSQPTEEAITAAKAAFPGEV